MAAVVSLNGSLVAPEDATISIFDRGFLYGDSVYEVIRTYQGVPFELEAHLQRLEGSARRLAMRLPVPLETIAEETRKAHAASGNGDSYIRIVCTRGSGPIGLDLSLAESPVRLVIVQPVKPPPQEVYDQGAKIALTSVRRNHREAIDPEAKTGNYLNSVMALAEAKQRGAYEAVMLDHRDFVTEGASSNVFMASGGVLLTPPIDVGILRGVTRRVVVDCARQGGLRVLELPINEEALKDADEVFITSSIREIVPIVAVDDTVIGEGRPGPIYGKVRALFDAYVQAYVAARS